MKVRGQDASQLEKIRGRSSILVDTFLSMIHFAAALLEIRSEGYECA